MTKTSTDAQIVGSVSFINGDAQQFTDAKAYLDCIREELPHEATTGFRFRTITQDPAVRKAVDDNAYTAGLALNTALYPFKRLTRRTTTIIVAILAVAGACFGLGSLGFISFVAVFQGSFNMSLVGVMIAHYFVVSREVNRKGTYLQTTGFSGLIAWFVSGMLTYNNLLPLPFITNAVLAFVLYLALFYGIERKFKNVKEVPKVTPPRRVV